MLGSFIFLVWVSSLSMSFFMSPMLTTEEWSISFSQLLYCKYAWVVFVFKDSFRRWMCYVFWNRIELTVSRDIQIFYYIWKENNWEFQRFLTRFLRFHPFHLYRFYFLRVICLKVKVSRISKIACCQLRFLYLGFHSILSEQIALINIKMLEWFLPIVCKEHILTTNLLSRNHLKLCFWLIREGHQMPYTEQLFYLTDESSHRRRSIKKAVLKNFAVFTENTCVGVFSSALLKRDSNTGVLLCEIFKNTYFEEHLRTAASELTLEIDYLELCFGTVAFKTILTR